MAGSTSFAQILGKHEEGILHDWLDNQVKGIKDDRISSADLKGQCREFLSLLRQATTDGNIIDIDRAVFSQVREFLNSVSRTRGQQGYSPSETATFVFSLKEPVFLRLRQELGSNPEVLLNENWEANKLLDKLGLLTTEFYQKSREEVIMRQQQDMLELSTPVVKLWDGILALPLIGTLDSSRTQVVMESLLQSIVANSAEVAILDITGVPTVDTLVAQHLMKTVTAARLMGADCIISGIRPQIAQTIVHLGVDLGTITTKASLADAFLAALKRRNLRVQRATA